MFHGNARFKLLRRLGAGGMGVVYEAEDQQRKTRVALKTLQRADAHLLYRLKREFRSLRDLSHRNLVGLDELFEEDGNWFFTMELLDGDDLLTHLQRATSVVAANTPDSTIRWPRGADQAVTHPGNGAPMNAGSAPPMVPPPAELQPLDEDRVRDVFGQIAEGLLAIHEAGKIHRDIKPSNIIVTRDGRAVILDFGLVTEQWDGTKSGVGEIVGSVLYMAPEQAAAHAVGPAADWYSVGVMLYEVLAGRRPFDGAVGVVIAAKQYQQPLHLRSLDPRCPQDLAELCMQLLEIAPADRPQGTDVLTRLVGRGSGARIAQISRPIPVAPAQRVFVGREAELRQLQQAFDDVHRGGAVTAVVSGESGIGKTTLLHHFASALEREYPDTVVLSGQCREHEAVPFKAMDGVIDALARHVCSMSDVAAAELVPQYAALLPGVFPVLGRIPAIAGAPQPLHVASDPFQQRKRVFTALRDMLCMLTERCRLIAVIDDLQWVDTDSLLLLGELLRPPDEPRLLLLASVRSSDDRASIPPLPGDVRRIWLPRLNAEESVELATMLLDKLAPEQREQSTRIVDETAGHPLFIGELVRYAAADSRAAVAVQLRLDEAIWARASQLDASAMGVLQVLAMAVAPMAEEVVHAATGLDAARFQKSVALLRAGNLVRSAASTELLEVYHDRVRQSVVHHVDDTERIALNGRIAAALERATGDVPPELLIHHLEGAAQFGAAAGKAIDAAERAQAGLAFEQAVQLFETALRFDGWSEAERRQLLIKLGGALASAGRGPDAADAYRRAAENADPATQLSCRIQVADQLVQSGRLESGASLLFSLIREQGHDMPRSQIAVAVRILWYRMRLALRGLRWVDCKREDISPRDLALLSLYHAASRGLILVDPVRASYFVVRGLLLALDVGDRDMIMYFLVLETGFRGSEAGTGHRAFIERAQALMRTHDEPLFQSIYRLHQGSAAYLAIDRQFKEAFEILDRTDEELAQTANAAWWLSANRFFLIYSLHKMGDFARLRTYSERFVREAEQRGNVYTKTTLSRLCNILWLVDDDPDGARRDLTTDSWISYRQGYHSQHWLELNARVEIAIYEGSQIDRAFVAQHLAMLKKSFLQRVLGYGCDTQWLVGRLALSELARDPSRRRVVTAAIARLRRYNTRFTCLLAAMLHGTLAIHDRDHATAIAQLREVVRTGDETNIQFVTAAARRRLGALLGGAEGKALVEAGDRWMRAAGVKNLERTTELASPCGRALELLPETTAATGR